MIHPLVIQKLETLQVSTKESYSSRNPMTNHLKRRELKPLHDYLKLKGFSDPYLDANANGDHPDFHYHHTNGNHVTLGVHSDKNKIRYKMTIRKLVHDDFNPTLDDLTKHI